MHIVNVMFSKKLGGIEQSFVDYCEALRMRGHQVTAIITPHAPIKPVLLALKDVNIIEVKTLGNWDVLAKRYIKKIIQQIKPDAIINHGGRAACIMRYSDPSVQQIGVLHNYSFKRFKHMHKIFAVSKDLQHHALADDNLKTKPIIHIPNMIRLHKGGETTKQLLVSHDVPVIGAMGRFVKKKGFDVFIAALSILKSRNVPFKALIGGVGEEEQALKHLVQQHQLSDHVKFTGWVDNKSLFFEQLDIFCLPSLHEPFGIVLLEAFAYGLPVVTSDAEGPAEIANNQKDVLMVTLGKADEMADAIERLISDKKLQETLVTGAKEAIKRYEISHVAKEIEAALSPS